MIKAWLFPKISHDLAYAVCDYLREQNYFDILINLFIKPGTCDSSKQILVIMLFKCVLFILVRLCCGRVLEECLSLKNRDFVVTKGMSCKF